MPKDEDVKDVLQQVEEVLSLYKKDATLMDVQL